MSAERSVAIPDQKCPFCGYRMDRTDGIETKRPKVGDILLCLKCMEVCLFDKNFVLRMPTIKELMEIQRSLAWPKIEQVRAAWRKLRIKEQIAGDGR